MRAVLCMFLAGLSASALAAVALTEAEVRQAEADAARTEAELAAARATCQLQERRVKALALTAELMSGQRTEKPTLQLVERESLRLAEEPVTLDNRDTGKPSVWKKWLTLPGGRRYRVRARLAVDEISESKGFKFGLMVTQPECKTRWPSAGVGAQPFAEAEVKCDFFCPADGKCLLLIGFETGKGRATFRDVRISELTEELK